MGRPSDGLTMEIIVTGSSTFIPMEFSLEEIDHSR